MDYLFTHCEPLPRLLPVPFQVSSIGYMRRKADWIRRTFETCNFSFILSGAGIYRKGGQSWPVQTPCVITQWPDEFVEYGPEPDGRTWEELFLIYPAPAMDVFRASKLVDPGRPVWPLRNAPAVWDGLAELDALLRKISQTGTADRVDRLCERLIVESLLGATPSGNRPERSALEKLRRRLEADPGQTVDWTLEAAALGMSASTFRRRWLDAFGEPPGQTMQGLRVRRARRLLAETRLPVKEIAAQCGFDDPLYFSRRFRELTGTSARSYRRRHSESQTA